MKKISEVIEKPSVFSKLYKRSAAEREEAERAERERERRHAQVMKFWQSQKLGDVSRGKRGEVVVESGWDTIRDAGSRIEVDTGERGRDMSPETVRALVGAAVERGWPKIYFEGGSKSEKTALYVEAKRQGVEVKGLGFFERRAAEKAFKEVEKSSRETPAPAPASQAAAAGAGAGAGAVGRAAREMGLEQSERLDVRVPTYQEVTVKGRMTSRGTVTDYSAAKIGLKMGLSPDEVRPLVDRTEFKEGKSAAGKPIRVTDAKAFYADALEAVGKRDPEGAAAAVERAAQEGRKSERGADTRQEPEAAPAPSGEPTGGRSRRRELSGNLAKLQSQAETSAATAAAAARPSREPESKAPAMRM